MSNKHHFWLFAILLILFAPALYFSNNQPTPVSASTITLSGYAWSSNTGWISFGGADGGNVIMDSSSGNFSGYAWSENIGWIYFGGDPNNAGGIANAPEAPYNWAKINTTSGDVSGWARACSVFQSGCNGALNSSTVNGDWDGWIKMSGSNYGVKSTVTSGVRTFYGYAWGGGANPSTDASAQSPGWITFNYLKDQNNNTISPPPTACVTNCGFVTVTETVLPSITATCYVNNIATTPNQTITITSGDSTSLTLPIVSGGTGSYSVQWYVNNIPRGSPLTTSPYTFIFNDTVIGNYGVKATVSSGSASPLSLFCPDNSSASGNIVVVAPPPEPPVFYFDEPTLIDNAATVKFTNNDPTTAFKKNTTLPKVKVEGNDKKILVDLYVISVSKLTPTGEIIDSKYWNKDTAYAPTFSPNPVKAGESSDLTIKFTRQPNSTMKRLATGIYYVKIRGIPRDPNASQFDGYLKVIISSSGGIYIEQ